MSKGRKCFLVAAVSSIATTAAAAAVAACVQKRTLPGRLLHTARRGGTRRHTASARKFGGDVLSSCYELSLSSVEAKELSSVAVSQKCSHRSISSVRSSSVQHCRSSYKAVSSS